MANNDWKTIESEPEDGREAIYFSPGIGTWIGCKPTEHHYRGYWSIVDGEWRGRSFGGTATHWMPAPSPPLPRTDQ